MIWRLSNRADPDVLPLADRHYNRQKPGTPQFVAPGRCLVLKTAAALWVTSWPFAEYTKHAWAGAWVNSLFRRESGPRASIMIAQAVAATQAKWDAPPLGIVSFVNPKHVRPTFMHGEAVYGFCYLKAGWTHVGYTKGGLWVWQQLPLDMPPAECAIGMHKELV